MGRKQQRTSAEVAPEPPSLDDLAIRLIELNPADLAAVARLYAEVERAASAAAPAVARELVAAASHLMEIAGGVAADPSAELKSAGEALERAMYVVAGGAPRAPAQQSARGGAAEQSGEAWTIPGPEEAEPDRLPADFDVELVTGYVAESVEYLESAEAALLVLEGDASDSEAVNTVFRAFHTLKGTSGFLGLERIARLAHGAESLLIPVRDRQTALTPHMADLALQAVDLLKALVAGVQRAAGGEAMALPREYTGLLRRLEAPDVASPGAEAEAGFGVGDLPAPSTPPDRDAARGTRPLPASADAGAAAPMGRVEGAGRGAPEEPGAGAARAPETWVRVRTDRLDRLVDMIGELVIAESMIAQDPDVFRGEGDLGKKVMHAGKIVRELQDLSVSMRMVPLKSTFQKLARIVRDAAHKSGKLVDFVTEGDETEIDRNMVEIIGDPLVHMIRNAVDHGIEAPEARLAAGKARAGVIRLSAYHAGGEVAVELTDDGRGLDRAKILAKAVAKGLVERDRSLSDQEVFDLIFEPGFSTAEMVTNLSGRGVGMDVVRRNVEALRGRVDIASEAGRGSTFTIRLPLTLAMADGMLVRIASERYIVPMASIHLSLRPEASALSTVSGKGEVVMLRDELLPIIRLHRLLCIAGAEQDPTRALLVVIGHGTRRCALLVDELLGQHQVVAKSLGHALGRVPGISGGAILGDGRVGLILDIGELVAMAQGGEATRRPAA